MENKEVLRNESVEDSDDNFIEENLDEVFDGLELN